MSERPMHDLSEAERSALMEVLLEARTRFARNHPRLAQWYHLRLVELAEDREIERRIIQAAELDVAGHPCVAKIIGEDDPKGGV